MTIPQRPCPASALASALRLSCVLGISSTKQRTNLLSPFIAMLTRLARQCPEQAHHGIGWTRGRQADKKTLDLDGSVGLMMRWPMTVMPRAPWGATGTFLLCIERRYSSRVVSTPAYGCTPHGGGGFGEAVESRRWKFTQAPLDSGTRLLVDRTETSLVRPTPPSSLSANRRRPVTEIFRLLANILLEAT